MREHLQPGDKAAPQHQTHASHPRDTTAQHRASDGTRWVCGSLAPQAVVRRDRSAIRPRSHAAGTPSIQLRQRKRFAAFQLREGCDLSWAWTPGLSRAAPQSVPWRVSAGAQWRTQSPPIAAGAGPATGRRRPGAGRLPEPPPGQACIHGLARAKAIVTPSDGRKMRRSPRSPSRRNKAAAPPWRPAGPPSVESTRTGRRGHVSVRKLPSRDS